VQIQFLENVGAMSFHRVHAQMEIIGDIFIALPFGDQLQDFTLPR